MCSNNGRLIILPALVFLLPEAAEEPAYRSFLMAATPNHKMATTPRNHRWKAVPMAARSAFVAVLARLLGSVA